MGWYYSDEEEESSSYCKPPKNLVQVNADGHLIHESIYCHFTKKLNYLHRRGAAVPEPKTYASSAVEVYGVYLYNLSKETRKMFGKIELGSFDSSSIIYDQPEHHPDLLKPYGCIALPLTCDKPSDVGFQLSSCLCDAVNKSIVNTRWTRNDFLLGSCADGPIDLHVSRDSNPSGETDQMPKTHLVVRLIYYSSASVAKVTVKLSPASRNKELHGKITAASTKYPDYESVLYSKKQGNDVIIQDGILPLMKSLVTVPFWGGIILRVKLPDIGEGEVTLPVGEKEDRIEIEGGILLTVNWLL